MEYSDTNRAIVDPVALKGLTTLWLRGSRAAVARGLDSLAPTQREAMESAIVLSVRAAAGPDVARRASMARHEAKTVSFANQVERIVRHPGTIR